MASDMSDFDPTTSTDSDNSCLFKIQKAVTCKDDSFFFVKTFICFLLNEVLYRCLCIQGCRNPSGKLCNILLR